MDAPVVVLGLGSYELHFSVLGLLVPIMLLGLIVGSFLNVVIWRLPRMLAARWGGYAKDEEVVTEYEKSLTLSRPGSHCTTCHTRLEYKHLVPVFSFLFLRGRCGFCGTRISRRYPVVELLSLCVTAALAVAFIGSALLLPALLMGWTLICLAFIDLEHHILPDELTMGLLWVGLLVNGFGMFVSPESAIFGAIGGYLTFSLVFWVFFLVTKKEGLGQGDMKFLAALGAWFGWLALPELILIASLSGLCVNLFLLGMGKIKRSEAVPFGPWLAVAGAVHLVMHPQGSFTQYFFS